jgi:hypothetical protein
MQKMCDEHLMPAADTRQGRRELHGRVRRTTKLGRRSFGEQEEGLVRSGRSSLSLSRIGSERKPTVRATR